MNSMKIGLGGGRAWDIDVCMYVYMYVHVSIEVYTMCETLIFMYV